MNWKIPDFLSNEKLKVGLQNFEMKFEQVRPEVLLATGIVSALGATIWLCTQTDKTKEAVKKMKEESAVVDQQLALPPEETGIIIPDEVKRQNKIEKGKQYTAIYGRFVYELIKIYGLPALLWMGGMGLIVGGHVDLRNRNEVLVAQILGTTRAFTEYRSRVANAVGPEVEEKLYMGAQDGKITVLEKDEKTGEEKLVKKNATEFVAQPGSIFAINFVEENVDFKWRRFPLEILEQRVDQINNNFETGYIRALTGLEIYRQLGITEQGLGDNDEFLKALCVNGISANARKVSDPEMRKLKIKVLTGYVLRHDPGTDSDVWVECIRIDPNFYPLEGKI